MPETVLVSACLLGLNTRYDGNHNCCEALLEYLQQADLIAIPICPEQLAGLPTPRPKVWFTKGDGAAILEGQGRMVDETGRNMGAAFLHGAEMCLQIARCNQSKMAILKQHSPSCGCRSIHRSGETVPGMGVTAALLGKHNIKMMSEEDFTTD